MERRVWAALLGQDPASQLNQLGPLNPVNPFSVPESFVVATPLHFCKMFMKSDPPAQ